MKRFILLLVLLAAAFTATAQSENSIIIDQNTFHPIQSDALTGVAIDKIGMDSSRRPCARIKVKINRMGKDDINKLEVKIYSNNQLTKSKTAEYNNGLIIEMTAKNETRFYFYHPEFGYSNEVNINLEPNKEYYLEASLNQTYSIVVNSNVADAEVYLDKVFKGRTDNSNSLTIKGVMIGDHTLKVDYNGVVAEQKIVVNGDNISFRLGVNIAASEPQYVVFSVKPENAVVIVDNQYHTLVEGMVMLVRPRGTYNYTVTAAGYHSQSGTFTVEGQKIEKIITLTADAANVTLTAPDDAEIWVNGVQKGTGRWSGMLASGTYIFEARKAGHKSSVLSKTIISAAANQSYALSAPTPIVGKVTISSTPLMTDVTLDGKIVGRTPIDIPNLLVGTHTVKISKAGYADNTQTITISEGKTTMINATLTKGGANANIGGFDMVFVKGGTFTMGATAEQGSDAYGNEKPTHSVTVSDFYIGKYEVTQAQWRAVMGSNPSYAKGDNLPVEQVSWDDVQEFIQRLNAQTGKRFRLPTEAEWEYAARGGNQSKCYKYSGSNNLYDVAWHSYNSGDKTHPVGQKTPNELGIYDMSGNVSEWCQDWYGAYSSSSQTNPTGPSSGAERVLRGGCSPYCNLRFCRVSYRSKVYPGHRSISCGFRLVLEP